MAFIRSFIFIFSSLMNSEPLSATWSDLWDDPPSSSNAITFWSLRKIETQSTHRFCVDRQRTSFCEHFEAKIRWFCGEWFNSCDARNHCAVFWPACRSPQGGWASTSKSFTAAIHHTCINFPARKCTAEIPPLPPWFCSRPACISHYIVQPPALL